MRHNGLARPAVSRAATAALARITLEVDAVAATADEANDACWISDHECIVRHVTVNDGAGTDERVPPDGGAAHYCAVRTQTCALSDEGRP